MENHYYDLKNEYLPVALAAEANKSENFIFRKFYIEFVEDTKP